jgi:AraC-like DNA-binding protein
LRFDHDLRIEAYLFQGIMQKFPNHFHEYYVCGFVESGRRLLSCKNQQYAIESGDLVLFNPFDNHTCEQMDDQALNWRCLNIEKDVMGQISKEITGRHDFPIFQYNVVCKSDLIPDLRELHDRIISGSMEFDKEEDFYFLMERLIAEYAKTVGECQMQPDVRIEIVCDYIENHYAERITLADLSDVSGVNKYTLLRNFTMEKGITPYQYLSTTRVNYGKRLLELGKSSMEVALEVGFSDQSHFTRFFKNFIGITPKLYQSIFLGENNIRTGGEHEDGN